MKYWLPALNTSYKSSTQTGFIFGSMFVISNANDYKVKINLEYVSKLNDLVVTWQSLQQSHEIVGGIL